MLAHPLLSPPSKNLVAYLAQYILDTRHPDKGGAYQVKQLVMVGLGIGIGQNHFCLFQAYEYN